MNQRHFTISNLENVENEFNVLIPIKNVQGKLPNSIVLGFANNNRNSLGVSGLD